MECSDFPFQFIIKILSCTCLSSYTGNIFNMPSITYMYNRTKTICPWIHVLPWSSLVRHWTCTIYFNYGYINCAHWYLKFNVCIFHLPILDNVELASGVLGLNLRLFNSSMHWTYTEPELAWKQSFSKNIGLLSKILF